MFNLLNLCFSFAQFEIKILRSLYNYLSYGQKTRCTGSLNVAFMDATFRQRGPEDSRYQLPFRGAPKYPFATFYTVFCLMFSNSNFLTQRLVSKINYPEYYVY